MRRLGFLVLALAGCSGGTDGAGLAQELDGGQDSAETGGTTSTGGRHGGTGGAATGGLPAAGGVASTGGETASGGATVSTGGAPEGGAVDSGPDGWVEPPTGGAPGTGGTTATGGATGAGGATDPCPGADEKPMYDAPLWQVRCSYRYMELGCPASYISCNNDTECRQGGEVDCTLNGWQYASCCLPDSHQAGCAFPGGSCTLP